MNDTQLQPMTAIYAYTTPMPEMVDDTSGPYLQINTLMPDAPDWDRLRFERECDRTALANVKDQPPKTVGELWVRYLRIVQTLANLQYQNNALTRALQTINQDMNEYASINDFCESYEEALHNFNRTLSKEGYTGWFMFEGRVVTRRVLVQRVRHVQESIWVDVETRQGTEDSLLSEEAIEIAEGMDPAYWDVLDDEYDTTDYDVTDID